MNRLMEHPFKEITEQKARLLIDLKMAGYWEVSLRDSISKTPIPHDKEICVYLQGKWMLIPAEVLKIIDCGRQMVAPNASCAAHKIECNDPYLVELFYRELKDKAV
jgi:hypothetical protein